MIREHDRIVLTTDLPDGRFRAGDIGVVVMIHGDHAGYEVEFFTLTGDTLDVVTVDVEQVRPVSEHEILHARAM
ncbi:MAG: DUF4926 domain-containing protein [Chloroflexi bacterium]|nr:DUF4926 domain-containing protein [Chloroflexota bacterium]MBK9124458.1 DUF4926 domain-containing protein [Chloroflexota bacterium]